MSVAMARKPKAQGKQIVMSPKKLKGPIFDPQTKVVKSMDEVLGVSALDVDNIAIQEAGDIIASNVASGTTTII